VSEDQVRQKMTADGWNSILITRERRYFQIMGFKDQQTSLFTMDSQNWPPAGR